MGLKEGDMLKTPETLQEMMVDAANAVSSAMGQGVKRISVEVPLPITGGTELDDWPGGIKQKYGTLRPMVGEMMKVLNFTREEMEAKNFLGYVDDAIGIWEGGDNLAVVCFPTTEVARELEQLAASGKTVVVVNSQFFIDPFSSQEGKDFDASLEKVYLLQSLNLKGPGLLPVKGVLLRTFPDPFTVARKVDGGDREVIATYDDKPERKILEELFFKDSEERDKNLSLFDRLKKIQKEASNI